MLPMVLFVDFPIFSLMPMMSITRVENTNGKNFSHRRTQTNIIEAKIQVADYYAHYTQLHTLQKIFAINSRVN